MIPYGKHHIDHDDIKSVIKVLKSDNLTQGPLVKTFENAISKYVGSKYAVAVSSCTAGLHLSCIAAGFKRGDEVIIPAQTHVATAHAVEYTGAKAVFADVTFPEGNLDLDEIKRKITL